MKTKHVFVAVLDVNEIMPFAVSKEENLEKGLQEQEKYREELVKFIDLLEKNFKQKVYYMGMDIIEAKYYERYMFDKNGFLEVIMDKPVAINAHFTEEKNADKFKEALKKTLIKVLPESPVSQMFVESIQVQTQKEQSLTYNTWTKLKDIRNK